MIKSFRHKGLCDYFLKGSMKGIQAKPAFRLTIQLSQLNIASAPADMAAAGWNLHPLKGELEGLWAISVSGNWRLTFAFEEQDVVLVDYQDYH